MTFLYIRPVGAIPRIIPRFIDLRGCSSKLYSSLRRSPTPQWHSRCLHAGPSTVQAQTQTQTAPSSTLSLSDQVRLLMRHVPYPVAIITSTEPNPNPHDHHHDNQSLPEKAFRGMTVSSFNTVTLTPEPVISFNVKRPSETLSALQSSARFLVHLLAPGPRTAALARDFSRGNHNLTIVSDENGGDFEFTPHTPTVLPTPGVGADAKTEGVIDESSPRLLPLPLLRRKNSPSHISDDFPFVLECRLHPQSIQVHDHTIVVGTVVRALTAANMDCPDVVNKASAAEQLCLTYANTRFWAMGHEI